MEGIDWMCIIFEMNGIVVEEGVDYVYRGPFPADRIGCLYTVAKVVTDVPSYQKKVVMKGKEGPDEGQWFSCSLNDFSKRFELIRRDDPEPAIVYSPRAVPVAAVPEKVVDYRPKQMY